MSSLKVYLNNAASTAADPAVIEAMLPFFGEQYANPADTSLFAAFSRNAVEIAREQVAYLIGADPSEIVFTSGGTESDNMAVFGTAVIRSCDNVGRLYASWRGVRIITDSVEHPAVMNPCRELEKRGCEVIYAPCDANGLVDTEFIKRSATPGTALISVMLANNELGTVQNVCELKCAAAEAGALLHTDAVQAAGHMPVDVKKLGVDLLSISSHKIHGPKGVGALFVKKGTRLQPLIYGGGHEKRLRPGTLNVPGIVGFGKACELARNGLEKELDYLSRLKNMFIDRLTVNLDGVHINSPENSVPSILSVSFDGIEGSSLLIELDMKGICCSTGSACSASNAKPSHVLSAAGLSSERLKGSIRFSFSRFNTDEELEYAAKVVKESVERLRRLCGYAR
ncbi:MAG: cysteine desulfurase [Lachnospiraceae bacterium]|nr:cysteine desulfurase [Lachnospiraceae bacterium]